MGLVYQYLYFAGKSSEDFNCHISGSGTFLSPERDVKSVSVPGRNGDLHIDNGRYYNVEVVYPAFITKDFRKNFDALKAFLLSQRGYKRLEDTYHPEYYRRARFAGRIEPVMSTLNRAGSFELKFDCDPRRFLKEGEQAIELIDDATLLNQTYYEALPLIRAYKTSPGSGASITVNGATLTNTAVGQNYRADIDCELMDVVLYDSTETPTNGNPTTTGTFPTLIPGANTIVFKSHGFSRIEIIPRWWTI